MGNVLVNKVVKNNSCCVRESFLSILKGGFFASISYGIEIWREDKSLKRPISQFSKPDSTIIHVNFFLVLMLKLCFEEKFLCSLFNGEYLQLWALSYSLVKLICINKVEMQIVCNAVSSH